MSEADQLWRACTEMLREQVKDGVWLSTFQDIVATGITDDGLVLRAPSGLVRDRLEGRYSSLIRGVLDEAGGDGIAVIIDVDDTIDLRDPERPVERASEPERDTRRPFGSDLSPIPAIQKPAVDPPQNLNPRYTFEAFVPGASNRFAHAAALSVAERPAKSYNPLFIYGDAGLGKTHLLHAIGHYVAENYPGSTIRYVSTETFLNQFVDAIRTDSPNGFKRHYRNVDVLLIDDIQFMEGKEGLQEEFFHTFNALHEADRQIVISSDRPPDSISTLEDRLRTRFKMGLTTDIQPPDIETRQAILRKKAERETAMVDNAVLELIATHITSNIRELEGALIRVVAYASLNRERITKELAEKVLDDIIVKGEPRPITPAVILEAAAQKFDFTIDELKGKSRVRPLAHARQVAMYVFRDLTDLSYPQIAREFGGRDHTTVIHAYEKINALIRENHQVYDEVAELTQSIKAGD